MNSFRKGDQHTKMCSLRTKREEKMNRSFYGKIIPWNGESVQKKSSNSPNHLFKKSILSTFQTMHCVLDCE